MPVNGDAKKILRQFEQVLEDPIGYVRRYKSDRRVKVIGWLLTDVPEELIHAARALPFGIIGSSESFSWADAHLQAWACSLMRSCLGLGVKGRLSFLDGLIIPHTCDTTRNLGGIWKHTRPLPMMENYLLPRQVDRPSARSYLIGELGRLKAKLEHCAHSEITAERLKESIALYNRNRALIRKLFSMHADSPDKIGNMEMYNIIKSSMFMPKEDHNRLLEQLAGALGDGAAEGGAPPGRIRVMLSGKVWEPPEIMKILDDSGAVVVADDLATGHRYFSNDVPVNGDPIEALALRQINRMPFACFGSSRSERRAYLTGTAGEKGAEGVIFIHLKYCEPENFDYPDMKAAFEAAGIPSLRIETELGNLNLGQIETRIQAFLEMLRGGGAND
ncbi:MAG: 2-hydroxyacyl-CoA dehydratase subunit D [Bacillota bacterium]